MLSTINEAKSAIIRVKTKMRLVTMNELTITYKRYYKLYKTFFFV